MKGYVYNKKLLIIVLCTFCLLSFETSGAQVVSCPQINTTEDFVPILASEEDNYLAQGYSSICRTPKMICGLPQPGPVGARCWCIGPSGPMAGQISAN
jgi:hypothetical protein